MKHRKLVPFFLLLWLGVQAQEKTAAATESFFSLAYFNFWMGLLYVLVLGLAAWGWWGLKASLERHRSEIEALKVRNSNLSVTSKRPTLDEMKKQVEMLVDNHPKWDDAQADLNALIIRLEKLESVRQAAEPQATTENPVKKDRRPAVPETFFMSYPVNDYFPITAKSDTRDNTVYRFHVRASKTEADFEVHTAGAPIGELIAMVQTYIKPACDEENMPTQGVRNIVTTQPGLATLEGDKWIIKKKALIRYE